VQQILTGVDEDDAISGATCAVGKTCSYSFQTSIDHGRTWHNRGPMPSAHGQIIATRAGESITAYAYGDETGGDRILQTTTDGTQWSNEASPCSSSTAGFSADADGGVWLVCGSQPGAGNQGKEVYRSADGSGGWRLVARTEIDGSKRVGSIQTYSYVNALLATSPTTAFLATDRGTLLETIDGGVTWKQDPGWDSGEDFFYDLTFIDADHGWVAARTPIPGDYADRIYYTTDAGKTWRISPVPK
jgi:photosystem II stability/assembly factor-like uncharacterized protein